MVITRIRINGFGKLKDLDISLSDKINIVIGDNEAGKSTMHLFIRSMLFGAPVKKRRQKKSAYERMRPWNEPKVYGGSLYVRYNGAEYRIDRDFNISPDDLKVFKISQEGEKEIEDAGAFMSELLDNLSENAYLGTVSSGQLSGRTGREMADEIRSYAANISSSANPNLDVDKAIKYIEAEKNRLSLKIDHDALRRYNMVLGRIKELKEKLKNPAMANRILEVEKAEDIAKENAENTSRKIADNEIAISALEDNLRSVGLRDAIAVEELNNKTTETYYEYVGKKKASGKYFAAGAVFFILGVMIIAFCVSDTLSVLLESRGILYAALIIGAAAVIIGTAAIAEALFLKRRQKELCDELSETISKHTGKDITGNIDDEVMRNFSRWILNYNDKAKALTDAQDKKSELIRELRSINEECGLRKSELEIQRRISLEAEEGLKELERLNREAEILVRKAEENNHLMDEIEAAELAEETLRGLSEEIRKAAGTYINKEAGRMLKGLTGGIYDSLSTGIDYEIKINSANGLIPLEELSQGTMDQAYMAVRLAAIRFITGSDDKFPLVLDDSFVMYDDNRLLSAIRFIADNYKGQIIIFTCQHRERDILLNAGVSFNSIGL